MTTSLVRDFSDKVEVEAFELLRDYISIAPSRPTSTAPMSKFEQLKTPEIKLVKNYMKREFSSKHPHANWPRNDEDMHSKLMQSYPVWCKFISNFSQYDIISIVELTSDYAQKPSEEDNLIFRNNNCRYLFDHKNCKKCLVLDSPELQSCRHFAKTGISCVVVEHKLSSYIQMVLTREKISWHAPDNKAWVKPKLVYGDVFAKIKKELFSTQEYPKIDCCYLDCQCGIATVDNYYGDYLYEYITNLDAFAMTFCCSRNCLDKKATCDVFSRNVASFFNSKDKTVISYNPSIYKNLNTCPIPQFYETFGQGVKMITFFGPDLMKEGNTLPTPPKDLIPDLDLEPWKADGWDALCLAESAREIPAIKKLSSNLTSGSYYQSPKKSRKRLRPKREDIEEDIRNKASFRMSSFAEKQAMLKRFRKDNKKAHICECCGNVNAKKIKFRDGKGPVEKKKYCTGCFEDQFPNALSIDMVTPGAQVLALRGRLGYKPAVVIPGFSGLYMQFHVRFTDDGDSQLKNFNQLSKFNQSHP